MALSFEELSEERKKLQAEGLVPDWYTTQALQMFMSNYQVAGEVGVRGRMETIAKTLSSYMVGEEEIWEKKFFRLMWKGWLSPASPVLANTGTDKGMSISCSGGYIGDSIDSFYKNIHEQAILSKYGFGCSGDFSDVRPRGSAISKGGKASGVVPVIEDFATMAAKVSQSGNRRGSTASYLNIDHGDFDELIDKLEYEPEGLNIGWTVDDNFIAKLKVGDKEACRRFSRSLYVKMVTGKGYFFFIDKANRARPLMYKDLGLDIKASNLCSEIMLHSSESLSFSCVLSSMNLYRYDEWKGTEAVFESQVFLDCVVSDFIVKSEGISGLEKVRNFTIKGRATGLGVLGFSSYLQKQGMAFEDLETHFLNIEIFKHLHDETLRASQWLAQKFGEPEWCKGYGVRGTHRLALAPTKSTSLLQGGMSESVFPDPAVMFEQSSAAGGMNRITPEFYKLMVERGKYDKETTDHVINNVGSVQGLSWLTDREKEIYKTAFEVDQNTILRYASVRQKYLCQGQSLNFFFSEDGDEVRISEVLSKAFFDPNILSVYYFYSRSGIIVSSECVACEG